MKLLILRHAKSSWDHPNLRDIERPLNKRGRRTAPQVGNAMQRNGILPDRVLCSTAVRTRQTLDLIKGLMPKAELSFHDELYLASPSEMLDCVRTYAPHEEVVMLIAHNPGVTYLVNQLTDSRIDNIPTAGLACVEMDRTELAKDKPIGRLLYFVYPKLLDQ